MGSIPETLKQIITHTHGRAILDARSVEEQLCAVHGNDSRVWPLVAAAREDVPRLLRQGVSAEALAHRLITSHCLDQKAAIWCARAWEFALGLALLHEVPTLQPAPSLVETLGGQGENSMAKSA